MPVTAPLRSGAHRGLRGVLALALVGVLAATAAAACTPASPEVRITAGPASEQSRAARFTVSLSVPASREMGIRYVTERGTASHGADYVHTAGTLQLPKGARQGTVVIPVVDDDLDEPDETVLLRVLGATGAVIVGDVAAGTIVDDDPPPAISVVEGTMFDEALGPVEHRIEVGLAKTSGKDVSVRMRTVDGSATAPADYTPVDERVTIPAGSLFGSVTVLAWDDVLDEGSSETFQVVVSEPVNATLGSASTTIPIADDDAPPSISVLDARSLVEADTELVFPVVLSGPSSRDIEVRWTTSDLTAEAGTDYRAAAGTLRIPAGQTAASIRVTVFEDWCDELAEHVGVEIEAVADNPVSDGAARGRISDDGDPEPC
jgi:hypothetical protein